MGGRRGGRARQNKEREIGVWEDWEIDVENKGRRVQRGARENDFHFHPSFVRSSSTAVSLKSSGLYVFSILPALYRHRDALLGAPPRC